MLHLIDALLMHPMGCQTNKYLHFRCDLQKTRLERFWDQYQKQNIIFILMSEQLFPQDTHMPLPWTHGTRSVSLWCLMAFQVPPLSLEDMSKTCHLTIISKTGCIKYKIFATQTSGFLVYIYHCISCICHKTLSIYLLCPNDSSWFIYHKNVQGWMAMQTLIRLINSFFLGLVNWDYNIMLKLY